MADVIDLSSRPRPARDTPAPEGGARILLFLGVRYERHADAPDPLPALHRTAPARVARAKRAGG